MGLAHKHFAKNKGMAEELLSPSNFLLLVASKNFTFFET